MENQLAPVADSANRMAHLAELLAGLFTKVLTG